VADAELCPGVAWGFAFPPPPPGCSVIDGTDCFSFIPFFPHHKCFSFVVILDSTSESLLSFPPPRVSSESLPALRRSTVFEFFPEIARHVGDSSFWFPPPLSSGFSQIFPRTVARRPVRPFLALASVSPHHPNQGHVHARNVGSHPCTFPGLLFFSIAAVPPSAQLPPPFRPKAFSRLVFFPAPIFFVDALLSTRQTSDRPTIHATALVSNFRRHRPRGCLAVL